MTRVQRDKQCTTKQRFADESAAKAWGATRQERTGTPLWVYHCSLCRGYHLTRNDNGPAASVMADLGGGDAPSDDGWPNDRE
ncbi:MULTISPECIES: hypothetical protein [Cupriavidus]